MLSWLWVKSKIIETLLTTCVRSGQASGCRNVIWGQSGEYEENVTHNIYLEVSEIKLAGAGEWTLDKFSFTIFPPLIIWRMLKIEMRCWRAEMIHLVTGSAGMKHDALGQGLHYHYTCLNQSQRPPILYTLCCYYPDYCLTMYSIYVVILTRIVEKRLRNHHDTADFSLQNQLN